MNNNVDIAIMGSLKRGGAERVTVRLAKFFSDKGKRVAVVTSTAPSEGEYVLDEKVLRVSVREKTAYMTRKEYPSAIKKYHKILKQLSPKIIIVMSVPECSYIIPATFGVGAKVIVSERNDPAHFAGSKLIRKVSRFFMKFSDGYVFQTEEARDFYSKKIASKSVIIANPLSDSEIPNVDYKQDSNKIVSMGRLHKQKNHKLLINAFANLAEKHPEMKLVIYGEGGLREETEKYIYEKSMQDYVTLPGNKPDVLSHITDARIFVLSSDFEGMPNALMEAMAMGLPCISTDCPCGGPRTLIKNGENGILVPVGDSAALEEAMHIILDDSLYAKRIAENAKKIREEFTIDKIGEQWFSYINSLLYNEKKV